MLFFLTGGIQIGKTRWLEQLLVQLENLSATPVGTITPGQWVEHRDQAGNVAYEKVGISAVLLPQKERIVFAERADLVERDAVAASQAQRAQLSWIIHDDAIERINRHFDELAKADAGQGAPAGPAGGPTNAEGPSDPADGPTDEDGSMKRRVLVVDELGRLELEHGMGFTSAMALLDGGATSATPHAIVIVRDQLLPAAHERFANAPWGGMRDIHPDNQPPQEIARALAT